jgi:hypothetical protein
MNNSRAFKWRHFEAEIILLCVRWYLRYALSYRDLEEMMRQRGLHVDHTCAGYLGHPFRKRHLESDLQVPFNLQERSVKGRIREHACISCFEILLSLHKGEACVPCSHPSQATHSSLLSHAPRWHCSLVETALHLPAVRDNSRPCEREI